LEPLSHAVTTSCGHTFCARCILDVWKKRGQQDRPCECPVDRRAIAMLVPLYLLRGDSVSSNATELDAAMAQYNARFASAPRAAGERLREAHALGRSLLPHSLVLKVLLTAAVLIAATYFLLPRDLIPDSYGCVGYIDDACVALFCVWAVLAYIEDVRSKLIARLEGAGHT
jgi:uncharacterized membrane protein YkvA (DUF1232 family)